MKRALDWEGGARSRGDCHLETRTTKKGERGHVSGCIWRLEAIASGSKARRQEAKGR